MNVFTTDHPMASQQTLPTTRKDAWTSDWCNFLTVALIVCASFLAVTWLGMRIPDTPDVPDPSAPPSVVDLILAAVGFVVSFPASLMVQIDEPLGLTEKILVYTGVGFDGLFWALVIVSLHRFLEWHFRKRAFDA